MSQEMHHHEAKQKQELIFERCPSFSQDSDATNDDDFWRMRGVAAD